MITALIPARGGSKRIPGKNLKELGGVPLVVWACHVAKLSQHIGRIVVSSDDPKVWEATANHCNVVHERSEDAAGDDATDRDVILDYLKSIIIWPDMIVYLRPTSPLRRVYDVDAAIKIFKQLPSTSGLRSVHEMSESAYKCFELNYLQLVTLPCQPGHENVDRANLPNHKYPKTYQPNGIVDIIRPKMIAAGGTFGDQCMAYITKPTIEIDTPHDLKMAEMVFAHRKPEFRMEVKTDVIPLQ